MLQHALELLARVEAAGFAVDANGAPRLHRVRPGAELPADLLAELGANRIDVLCAVAVRKAKAEWEAQQTGRAEVPLPWDDLADALERLDEARRHGSDDDIAVSLADARRARERVGALGGLLILMALDHAGLPVLKKLAAAFDGLAQSAWDRATRAHKRATWAVNEVQALRQRVAELERRLDDLTPGVGQPRLRVVG